MKIANYTLLVMLQYSYELMIRMFLYPQDSLIIVLEPEVLSEKEVFQEEGVKDKDKILQAGSGKAGPLSLGLEKGVAEG